MILLPAGKLLWAAPAMSSNCQALVCGWAAGLAKWYRGSWRGKTSSVYLILQMGRSPSFPVDYEYHLFVVASRGLSGWKPLCVKTERSFGWRAANSLGVWARLRVPLPPCNLSESFNKAQGAGGALCRLGTQHRAAGPLVSLPAHLLRWMGQKLSQD